MNLRPGTIFIWLAFLTLAMAQPAQATLGEAVDSIARDSKALSAVSRATISRSKYALQEISTGTTTVREFLTPSGVVFAVAWNGLVHPDLRVLLGSYEQEYRTAQRKQPRKQGRRQTRVKTERLVVETWGHMRNLQGRAYLPGLVPEGVSLYEIH